MDNFIGFEIEATSVASWSVRWKTSLATGVSAILPHSRLLRARRRRKLNPQLLSWHWLDSRRWRRQWLAIAGLRQETRVKGSASPSVFNTSNGLSWDLAVRLHGALIPWMDTRAKTFLNTIAWVQNYTSQKVPWNLVRMDDVRITLSCCSRPFLRINMFPFLVIIGADLCGDKVDLGTIFSVTTWMQATFGIIAANVKDIANIRIMINFCDAHFVAQNLC